MRGQTWFRFQVMIILLVLVFHAALSKYACETCICTNPKADFKVDCTQKLITDEILSELNIPDNATILILDKNPISTLPPMFFSNLTKLSTLSLQSLNLNSIKDRTFGGLGELKRLQLQNNKLLSSAEIKAFEGLAKLEYLDLRANQFQVVPDLDVLANSELTELHLADNKKLTVANLGKCCSKLKKLVLSACSITSLSDDSFGGLSNLTSLDIGGNRISSISNGAFLPLSSLKSLVISNNPIAADSLKSLTQQLPTAIESLKIASLATGSLTPSADALFERLTGLQTLDMSKNDMEAISDETLKGLSMLLRLDLSSCGIQRIEQGALRHSPRLLSLKLGSNRLSTLPAGLFGQLDATAVALEGLQTLELQYNRVSGWPVDLFAPLSSLLLLNLSYNGVKVVERETVEGLPDGTWTFDLRGNEWICDCSLVWFRNWLSGHDNASVLYKNISVPVWQTFKCADGSDPLLLGRPFSDFTGNSLSCDSTTSARPTTSTSTKTNTVTSTNTNVHTSTNTNAHTSTNTNTSLCSPQAVACEQNRPAEGTPASAVTNAVVYKLEFKGAFVLILALVSVIVCAGLLVRYRYQMALNIHLFRVGRAAKKTKCVETETERGRSDTEFASVANDRDNATRLAFRRIDAGFEFDAYLLYADNERDRDWNRTVLTTYLESSSYRVCDGYYQEMTCSCVPAQVWSHRLHLMDSCANVIIVVSEQMDCRNNTRLLLEIQYAYDRAEKFPQLFSKPIVVLLGDYCVCGKLQKLPPRLITQAVCNRCCAVGAEGAKKDVLVWPGEITEESKLRFWQKLKTSLGLPLLLNSGLGWLRDNATASAEPSLQLSFDQ